MEGEALEEADSRLWNQIWWMAEANLKNMIQAYLRRGKSAGWFGETESLGKKLIYANPVVVGTR